MALANLPALAMQLRVSAILSAMALAVLSAAPINIAYAQQQAVQPYPEQGEDEPDLKLVPANPEDGDPLDPMLPLNVAPDDLTAPVPANAPNLEEAQQAADEAQAAALAAAAPEANAGLPKPVRAMIEAAIEEGKEATVLAVLDLARKTNPSSEEEIAAIRTAYREKLAAEKQIAEAEKVEALRTAGMLQNWDGRGELGAFQSTGNAEVIGVTAALTLNKLGFNWRHRLTGRADYQRSDGTVRREQYLATYEPNVKLSERLFAFGFGQFEQDRFQGFTGRHTLSAGMRYELVDDGALTLSAKLGPAWRNTDFVDGTNLNELAALGAFDLNWKVTQNITLTSNSNLILQNSNSTLVSQNGAIAKVASKLSVRLSHTLEYNTQPPVGSVTTDMLSRVTLIYDF